MTDSALKGEMIANIAKLHQAGARVVVVHGGGPQINAMLQTLNVPSRFIEGYRHSCEQTVAVVDMVLGGAVNQDLVVTLNDAGCLAVGLTGKDGKQFTIAPKVLDSGADLGYVADVVHIDTTLINTLLDGGYCVVIAPPSALNGVGYNVNADTVAGAVAGAVQADYFMALTNVAGILDADKKVVPTITPSTIKAFMADGTIAKGMLPKAQALLDALEAGTKNVVVADGTQPQAMIDVILHGNNGTLITGDG